MDTETLHLPTQPTTPFEAMSTSTGPPMHPSWHQLHTNLHLAITHYESASTAAITRLRNLGNRTTDSATCARYAQLITAETQKQAQRTAEYVKQSQGLMTGLDQPLKMMRQMRVEEFVKWLRKQVEEMKGVGVEDQDYEDVGEEEGLEEFEHIGVDDAEGLGDGVEIREGKGGWVGVVKR